jgi:hypothetical protein
MNIRIGILISHESLRHIYHNMVHLHPPTSISPQFFLIFSKCVLFQIFHICSTSCDIMCFYYLTIWYHKTLIRQLTWKLDPRFQYNINGNAFHKHFLTLFPPQDDQYRSQHMLDDPQFIVNTHKIKPVSILPNKAKLVLPLTLYSLLREL